MSRVITASYEAPEYSKKEILRYMGCRESSPETEHLIDECLSECKDSFSYDLVYTELCVADLDGGIMLGGIRVESRDIQKCLSGCDKAIILAATVGLNIDRLIHRSGRLSPSKALCLAAIGDERIEALCNAFCSDMKVRYEKEGLALRPRFSPGYGDLKIEFQKELFRLLECEKRLGLTLNDSLLMSPTKSVTAIIGIYKK